MGTRQSAAGGRIWRRGVFPGAVWVSGLSRSRPGGRRPDQAFRRPGGPGGGRGSEGDPVTLRLLRGGRWVGVFSSASVGRISCRPSGVQRQIGGRDSPRSNRSEVRPRISARSWFEVVKLAGRRPGQGWWGAQDRAGAAGARRAFVPCSRHRPRTGMEKTRPSTGCDEAEPGLVKVDLDVRHGLSRRGP